MPNSTSHSTSQFMLHSTADQIVQDLCFRNRNFCSSDYDFCLDYLGKIIPLEIHSFTEKDEFNGWTLPPKWDLAHGTISCNGRIIYEVKHPLQIICLSKSFRGTVSLEELKKHLHYDRRDPNAIPYHFRQNYRPWERDWGFCVTQTFYDSLTEGLYDVDILTKESDGSLKVATCTKKGRSQETFIFAAHLDHPGMANDDLAGVAAGVELFRRLQSLDTKFTYRLVLVQEIVGSVYYLSKAGGAKEHVLESCFLEMLGSNTELALQHSKNGCSLLEKQLEKTLQMRNIKYRTGAFRSIICNDENVWESYGIPMASLSRFPYPEYHSDKDNPSIISSAALEESVQVFFDTILELDRSILMVKNFEGVLALSNPTYNLYVDPGQPAFGSVAEDVTLKLRLLMDLIPMCPRHIFVEQLAAEVNLPALTVLDYLRLWEQKNLVVLK